MDDSGGLGVMVLGGNAYSIRRYLMAKSSSLLMLMVQKEIPTYVIVIVIAVITT